MTELSQLEKQQKWADPVVKAGAWAAVISTVISLLASWHWIPDLLTNFYAHIVVLAIPTLAYLIWRKLWVTTGLLLVATLFSLVPILPYFFGSHPGSVESGPQITLMSANVLYSNDNYQALLTAVNDADPDVVSFTEVTPLWETAFGVLDTDYPHSICDARNDAYGLCIYSKYELDGQVLPTGTWEYPTFAGTVEVEGAELAYGAIHASFPTFGAGTEARNTGLEDLADLLGQAGATNIAIMGDYNATPFTPVIAKVNKQLGLSDASLGTGFGKTYASNVIPGWLGGLRIDHALVSDNTEVIEHGIVTISGSDHKAVLVTLRLAL